MARGEYAENAIRKDFLPSEAVAIKRALEPAAKEEAKKRQSRQLGGTGEESRDKVAAFTGMGRTSLDKADVLVAAAKAEPEK